jgi:hypothetical protein
MLSKYSDDDKSRFDFSDTRTSTDSMIYKLEIMTIELFSMYGKQVMLLQNRA